MGENFANEATDKGLTNLQTAHVAEYQKNNPIKKWAEDLDIYPKKTYIWPKST